jgi:hypothetical protein
MRRDAGGDDGAQGVLGETARRLREAALEAPSVDSPIDLWGRAALWVFLAWYGWFYIALSVSRSQTKVSVVDYILGMANLVFHEAGHVILMPFGSFLSTLGGSLFQVLVPLVCLVAFLRRRDAFAAAVMLWWAGQNLIDVAPYINDARAQRLVLLGGVTGRDVPGYHDWNNLLTRLDMLAWDQALATLVDAAGTLLIVAALVWAAYLLRIARMQRRPASRLGD